MWKLSFARKRRKKCVKGSSGVCMEGRDEREQRGEKEGEEVFYLFFGVRRREGKGRDAVCECLCSFEMCMCVCMQ